MKVSKKEVEIDGFKPVELKIVFENQEELHRLKRMMGQNISIPEFMCEVGSNDYTKLQDMMDSIHRKL